MRERSDYIIPRFNDQFRFDKPPLTYWFQVASYRIFGETDLAARLPSAIAAAATAVALLVWGARVASPRVGWWAAVMFTLCLQTFMHAKAAVADMWLVLFVTLAHWAAYELLAPVWSESAAGRRSNTFRATWWFFFYGALALAFLAKGPIGWTPLLTLAAMKFLFPGAHLNRRFLFVRGLLLTCALIALWGVPALLRTHGEFFRVGIGRHVVARSVATMEGHGGSSLAAYFLILPFYFLTLFVSFFPWSIKLPWLAKQLRKGSDPMDKFLLVGAAVIFVIFTLVKTKLPHYTLPAFPLLALLLAKHLVADATPSRWIPRTAVATGGALAAIALLAFPFSRQYLPSLMLFEQACADLPVNSAIGAVDYTEPSIVWYFRNRTHGWLTTLKEKRVRRFMEQPGPRCVILPTPLVSAIFADLPAEWKTYAARGWNVVKGKRVDLTLVLKPS